MNDTITAKPKYLFLAGSARKDSANKKLAHNAFEIAKSTGVDATFIDLKDYAMPIYDGDLEDAKGLPQKAKALKKIFTEHDGIFIASPEYNASISPLLKNALDWVSRASTKDEPPLQAYANKVIALGSASPGMGGGRRGLLALKTMLENLRIKVTSEQIPVAKAYEKFDQAGHITDPQDMAQLQEVVQQLIRVTAEIKKG